VARWNGHTLKRKQVSRELQKIEVDGDYVPSRHVRLLKQNTTTDDDDDDDDDDV